MKTSKSPESAEVTPSKKKLKQARLPFMLISEVSPAPITPPRRKRKLSAPDIEPVPKVGKLTKENDTVEVVISDDDSKDGQTADKPEKIPNPYIKLVDTAIKKKQKSKASKKKRNSKKKTEVTDTSADKNTAADGNDNCEIMEVDELKTNQDDNCAKTDSLENEKLKNDKETDIVNKCVDIVILDDSNSSLDVKLADNKNKMSEESKPQPEDDVIVVETYQSTDEKIHKESSAKTDQVDSESPDKDSEKPEIKTPITPKRSARNKAKAEENNNKGSPSSKLNGSITSEPTTPKSRSSSVTKLDGSLNESTNLTPKQLQKKLESAKKKEKLEKEKQERERKRQEEKEERAKQRQEKDDLKKKEREEKDEAKKKEKEEKEEVRRQEKEEKEKQRELEKKLREEKEEIKRKEKEEKEEQRKKEKEAREEEKRKRQEALDLEKLEQEVKKKKAAEAFANFFVPKQKEKDQTVGAVNNCMLSSFTIKSDMRLAPTTRMQLTHDKAKSLEKCLKEQSVGESELYVKSLKNSKPMSSSKTWPLSDMKDDDVIIVEDELPPSDGTGEIITCDLAPREKLRPKLFSFHENRRPPYWGTWRKKSKFVKPRKPFGQDEKQLDYEVDSDDDWEEEAEGESLDGSAAGSDDEQDPNDEYEVDNEVFVPHGYLSDEEATMEEDDVLSLSPETQKARLKHLEDEFESEMKKPTEKLKPRLYGLLWESADGGKPDNCVDSIWSYFGKLSMIMNDITPLLQPSKEPEEMEKKKVKKKKSVKEGEGEQNPKPDKKKKVKTETEEKEPAKAEKKNVQDVKKNQPGINMFLKKFQSS